MTLPSYNPEAKCAQCGHDQVSTSYRDDNDHECQFVYAPPAYDDARSVCHYHRGPHFHRCCSRCGWRWAEAVQSPSRYMHSAAAPSDEGDGE